MADEYRRFWLTSRAALERERLLAEAFEAGAEGAEEFEALTGLTCRFETVVFRNRLDDEAKIALYRIAQEALTNVERHSGATEVRIDLRGHRRGATLRIADNGRGMQKSGSAASPGLGLRNMQERMEQLGGSIEIRQAKDEGTTIEATVPLSHMLPPEPAEPRKVAAE